MERVDQERQSAPSSRGPRLFPMVLAILVLHALPFLSRPAIVGGDEPHYALMASSIANDHDLSLDDDYQRVENGSNEAGDRISGKSLDRHLRTTNGRTVFVHPIGLPALASPLVAIQQLVAPGAAPDIPLLFLTVCIAFAALLVGWRLTAAMTGSHRDAALIVFCAYFGSPLWYYSRTFFTETYTWAFAVFAIALIRARRIVLASICLALVLAMKETGALLVVAILGGSAAALGLRLTLIACSGPLLYGAVFALKNIQLVGTPFSTFQAYRIGDPVGGMIGTLIDPAHGVTWFAPLLVAAAFGWFVQAPHRNLQLASAFAAVSYFVVSGAWIDWQGGSCYASRLVLPALPAMIVPLTAWWKSGSLKMPLLAGLFLTGFAVNWTAAVDPFTASWGPPALGLMAKNWKVLVPGILLGAGFLWYIARWRGWERFDCGT